MVAIGYAESYAYAILRADGCDKTLARVLSESSYKPPAEDQLLALASAVKPNTWQEYIRKTQVAAQIADESYSKGGLDGLHEELTFLRRMDADPLILAEVERLYHQQLSVLADQGLKYW